MFLIRLIGMMVLNLIMLGHKNKQQASGFILCIFESKLFFSKRQKL